MEATKTAHAARGDVMRFDRRWNFIWAGHYLDIAIDYDNKSWFCNEPECDFIGETKKELKKHKIDESHGIELN